ncbi:MAG: hypothetical protein V3T72_12655, partial [Thermoanaerobaculia bacterium]
AFGAPVKAHSDIRGVDTLVRDNLIDEEFVLDALAVDLTNPVFSEARCKLLELVPDQATPDWKEKLIEGLRLASEAPAQEFLRNLTDPERTAQHHRERAAALLGRCADQLGDESSVANLFLLLAQRRIEIAASEISQNPRGQILEPGFRVIFPRISADLTPGQLRLDEDCRVNETP